MIRLDYVTHPPRNESPQPTKYDNLSDVSQSSPALDLGWGSIPPNHMPATAEEGWAECRTGILDHWAQEQEVNPGGGEQSATVAAAAPESAHQRPSSRSKTRDPHPEQNQRPSSRSKTRDPHPGAKPRGTGVDCILLLLQVPEDNTLGRIAAKTSIHHSHFPVVIIKKRTMTVIMPESSLQ